MSNQVNESSLYGQTKTAIRQTTNKQVRDREYLEPKEIELLRNTVSKHNRHGFRDSLLILMAYRHGLRVSEIVDLKWKDIDFSKRIVFVKRNKNGEDSKQPLGGDEMRALRELQRRYKDCPYVFSTPTKDGLLPLSPNGIFRMIKRAGVAAGIEFGCHPHMLRHSCGYALVNKNVDIRAIQGYLGHKNIQHTVKYTALAENRFEGFEKLF